MLRSPLVPAAPLQSDADCGPMKTAAVTPPSVALLLLVRFRSAAIPWGLSRLVLGERAAGRAQGLRFARALGSGRDGGFGLVPSLTRQGLMCFFDDEDSALSFARSSGTARAYCAHADESLLTLLRATSCRGSWSGATLAVTASAEAGQPMASLTRAAIRPRHAARFWQHAPAAQAGVANAHGCRLAVGLGEAPLLRQATFSLWDNSAAMDAYARGGAHAAAIEGAWQQRWFSESMFVRFAPILIEGRWRGQRYG